MLPSQYSHLVCCLYGSDILNSPADLPKQLYHTVYQMRPRHLKFKLVARQLLKFELELNGDHGWHCLRRCGDSNSRCNCLDCNAATPTSAATKRLAAFAIALFG